MFSIAVVSLTLIRVTTILALAVVALVLTPWEALGATAPPRFRLVIVRAPIRLRRRALMLQMLMTDAMSYVAMPLHDAQAAMPCVTTLPSPAVPRRGCGSRRGCTYRTSELAMAVSWPSSCGTRNGGSLRATTRTAMTSNLYMCRTVDYMMAKTLCDMAKLHEFEGVEIKCLGRGETVATQLEGWAPSLGKQPLLPALAVLEEILLITHSAASVARLPWHVMVIIKRELKFPLTLVVRALRPE